MNEWRIDLHKKYGPVVQVYGWFGAPSFLYVDDPELVDLVTVKNNYVKIPEFVSANFIIKLWKLCIETRN